MRKNTRDIHEVLVNNIEENIDLNIEKMKSYKKEYVFFYN